MISVLMGTHAKQSQLEQVRRAVASVREQTAEDWEFLICDEGAAEEVCGWLREQAETDERMRIIAGGGANSLAKKLNLCFGQARGEWIARMDDDDYSYPKRLARQRAFLQSHSEYAAVGCNVWEVGGGRATVRELPPYPELKDFRVTFPFVHPALMFRREALEQVGGYSESPWQDHCDDYDLMLRLYERGGRGANLQEVLLDYNVVNSQLRRRPYRYFVNEFVTRVRDFYRLGKLPEWSLYAVKPLVVGLLPRRAVGLVRRWMRHG